MRTIRHDLADLGCRRAFNLWIDYALLDLRIIRREGLREYLAMRKIDAP
jgi:hypothetical protein